MDQPCLTGAQPLQRGQRRWRFNLQASKGTVQELLPQKPSLVQAVQWPLRNIWWPLKLYQSICTIGKIEYKHCTTSGPALRIDSNNCKQVQRRRPGQPTVFYGTWKNEITSVVARRFIFTRSQRRKKQRSGSQNKSRCEDQSRNQSTMKPELAFNIVQERNKQGLDEICKHNRFWAFDTISKDVNKTFDI
jgi:hypothetical protein